MERNRADLLAQRYVRHGAIVIENAEQQRQAGNRIGDYWFPQPPKTQDQGERDKSVPIAVAPNRER